MPEDMFKEIVGPDALLDFFRKEFPDVIPLIGEEKLIADYLKNQKLPLISLKCSPYNYRGKCVIIGDASHAVSLPTPILNPSFCMITESLIKSN